MNNFDSRRYMISIRFDDKTITVSCDDFWVFLDRCKVICRIDSRYMVYKNVIACKSLPLTFDY